MADRLRRLGHAVELVEIATRGDLERSTAIEEIGTRGVFTKEIQRALLVGHVDLGVHSLKDLPTESVDGLVLAAVPERESAADVLVCREAATGSEFAAAARGRYGKPAASGPIAARASRLARGGRARKCRYAIAQTRRGSL